MTVDEAKFKYCPLKPKFAWGNCIKYALRLGHKDDTASDAGKGGTPD